MGRLENVFGGREDERGGGREGYNRGEVVLESS